MAKPAKGEARPARTSARDPDRAARARDIVAAGRFLDGRGLAPATSGNYSARLASGRLAITVSGAHKGALKPSDILVADAAGRSLDGRTPSAETPLHAAVYALYPAVGAILHTHSVNATVLSLARPVPRLRLAGYELLKAFRGIATHEAALDVPVFENTQDMEGLARRLPGALAGLSPAVGFLIRGHGLYAWGVDMAEARRHVEAFEFLFACELERARIRT